MLPQVAMAPRPLGLTVLRQDWRWRWREQDRHDRTEWRNRLKGGRRLNRGRWPLHRAGQVRLAPRSMSGRAVRPVP
jgi:hypothetical protein